MKHSFKTLRTLCLVVSLSLAGSGAALAQFTGPYTGPKPSATDVLSARAQHAKAALWPMAFVFAASDDAGEVKAAFNQQRGTRAVQFNGGVYTKAVPNIGDTLHTQFYEILLAKEGCQEEACRSTVMRQAKEQAQAVKGAPHPGRALMEWLQKNA